MHLPRPRGGDRHGGATRPDLRRDHGQGRRSLPRQGRVHAPHPRGGRSARLVRHHRRPPADRLRRSLRRAVSRQRPVSLCFFGDGAVNIGAFHEALNLASVWRLPASSSVRTTSTASTHRSPRRRRSSGWPTGRRVRHAQSRIDGNDVRVVHDTVREAVEHARTGAGPTFIEALTYRHKGHSRSDPATYRPAGELDRWLELDPIPRAEVALREAGVEDARIDRSAPGGAGRRGSARTRRDLARTGTREPAPGRVGMSALRTGRRSSRRSRWLDADADVFLLGEDVGPAGGAFKLTAGVRALRRWARARHADQRAGDRRHRDRSRRDGAAPGGGDHVRRLRSVCFDRSSTSWRSTAI